MSRQFLIDGYNLIRKDPRLTELSLEGGRAGLIRFIQDARPHGSPRNIITVVFDGQEGIESFPSPAGVTVIFSRGESADDVIKRMAEDCSRPAEMIVVTDDRDLGHFCRSMGAEVWSVTQFFAKGKRSAQKSLVGGCSGAPAKGEAKVIGHVFEDRINRELRGLWLGKGK
ncbi:MAG: NYN domain-containing protein [Candidatus Omnitrophica bacterium]|nr:NYN domain-containing protein [Candidatus Omnitrophota bacterium]